jgi:hypothetical protein
MFIRSGCPEADPITIVDPLTGLTIEGCIEADTDQGFITVIKFDGNGRMMHDSSIKLANKSIVFPLLLQRQYRPFDIVHCETGEVIAEAK